MTTVTRWATEAREEAVARQGRPRPAITRDRWHRYTHEGVTYPGLTSVLGVMDKGGLLRWACRLTAEAAIEQLALLPSLVEANGERGVVDLLLNRADKRRDDAGARGSAIHDIAERVVRGAPMPAGLDGEQADVAARVADWWAARGWRLRLAEAFVVSPSRGYGGTLDLLAYDAEGRTVLADWKTGSGVYGEARLQLLGYGTADLVAPQGGPTAYPMPRIDRYVVLHVTASGVEEVGVVMDDLDREGLEGALRLHRWHRERKGRVA